MIISIRFLIFFWSFVQLKTILFWLYLWQLKEYRIDRFLAHFDTYKGKKIFFNPFFIIKLVLFATSFFTKSAYFFIFFLYFGEMLKIVYTLFRKTLILPVFTKKIIFLLTINTIFLLIFIFFISYSSNVTLVLFLLLGIDIFYPVLVSFSVFFFQPLVFIYKKWLFRQAKKKIENMKNLIVIGITGSYGKTSTKNFLAKILNSKFRVLKTEKNQNNEFSISSCIFKKLMPSHQIFICEIGAYRKGEVKKIAKIIKPKYAILTGLNEQHLALFGNMENLISAEGGKELIESLPKEGILILNGENNMLRKIYYNLNINKKIVALNDKLSDFWAEEILMEPEKISFIIKNKEGESAKLELNLIGAQNIVNLLLAICAAKIIGKMKLEEIVSACNNILPEDGGLRLIKSKHGIAIIDSSYSTNPDAVVAHLDYLKIWPKKKIIIMPCLIELGRSALEIHYKIGKKIREVCDLAIITTYDYFKAIQQFAGEKAVFLDNTNSILKRIIDFCEEGDAILLEGRSQKELAKLLANI